MSNLRIDGEALRAAARRIREVVDSLSTAGSDAHEAADYVGHGGLAGRVKDFADGWEYRRGKLGDELRQVADMLEAIDDTFTDLDNTTAGQLWHAMPRVMGTFARGGHEAIADPVAPLANGGGA